MRQSAVVIELVEHIDDFLGTTDGKRRNEQLSFAIDAGIFDHAEQFLFGYHLLLVQAVAVRRFADEIITLREEMGRRQDMTLCTTDVAGVSQALPSASRRRRMAIRIFIFFIYFQRADGSAEHVAGIGESEQHIVEETETAVVTVGNEMPHRLIDVLLVVQRFHFVFLAFLLMRVLTVNFLVVGTHVLLLYERRVGKHERTEVTRRGRTIDISLETQLHDVRD